MTDQLLVDIDGDGRVSVSEKLNGELANRIGKPVQWAQPLDADALEDLRWYLEDYLWVPFGVYSDRGAQVAARLPEWGARLFQSVLGTSRAHRSYVEARTRGRPIEVVIRSGAAQPLALPWELMRDPARQTPVALDHVAVTRGLLTDGPVQAFIAEGSRLRVLMVISRPGGQADVGYQMIAGPLLPLLERGRGSVELVVLRPPTLQRLEQVLANALDAGEPFQIVHFDGHGAVSADPEMNGMLAFEAPGGGWADPVDASRVARVLAASNVPVVVLNACRSGRIGRQVEATIATRLLQGGAASVVAMAYKVYVVAAAEFMAVFYERLFAGDRITDAVTSARQHLASVNERPSPKGPLPLADWIVPVHYTRGDVRFPSLRSGRSGQERFTGALSQIRAAEPGAGQDAAGALLAPVGSFVGRGSLLGAMETATRLHKVVVLHGQAGIGKTEVAKGFGRWWRDTNGVDDPGWVVWHSFEPGGATNALAGVIDGIGGRACGPEFAQLGYGERRTTVLELLEQRRLLLIWDNFESAHTMPDPASATPPLSETELADLGAFLAHIRKHCASSVIITSRTREDWLEDVGRIEVGGLTQDEAIDYANQLLEPFPHTGARRAQRAFGELMQWLDGHPLSMRLIIPLLDSTDPLVLLDSLHGITPLPGGDGGGRTASLPASITYSFGHLPPEKQQMLIAVAVFHGNANAAVLAGFSRMPEVPERFRGHSADDWVRALDKAATVGLLTRLDGGMYRIHPALPAYLISRWRIARPDAYEQEHTAATRALLAAYGPLCELLDQQIESGAAQEQIAIVGAQRRTLGALMGYALEHRLWEHAQAIAQPLIKYCEIRGLPEEVHAWADRALLAVGNSDGTAPDLASPEGRLWLFFAGSKANQHVSSGRLDEGERDFQAILRAVERQPAIPGHLGQLAGVYLGLGRIARRRGRFDQAESWYQQALAGREQLGDQPGIAASYYQLANIALERRHFDQAATWYRRSLAIFEDLDDQPGLAMAWHSLGIVSQQQGELDAAQTWCRKALSTFLALGDRFKAATSYYQLGRIAQEGRRWVDAENWYRQALTLREELGDRPGIAACCHQLGIIAQDQHRWAEAENWYRKSLPIFQELGNQPGLAASFGQLGLLAQQQGHPQLALEWVIRCVALFDQFPHPATGPGPHHLQELTAGLGAETLERTWQQVTGNPIPRKVRLFAETAQ
jgi:tetratricopeptide (TPR) repeat protein